MLQLICVVKLGLEDIQHSVVSVLVNCPTAEEISDALLQFRDSVVICQNNWVLILHY